VAGAAFDPGLAARVLGKRPVEVAEAADGLEREGFFRRGAPAHDLVVEAVLDGLSDPERRHWHLELARALEARPDCSPARVAYHYRAAGKRADAARLLMEAAARSERAYAYPDALEQYAEALRLAPRELRLSYELASLDPRYRMLLALMRWEELSRLLERVERLAARTADPELAIRGRLGWAGYRFARGELEEARRIVEGLLEGEAGLRPEHEATARYIRAVALQAEKRYEEALVEALGAVERYPDPAWAYAGWAHNTAAICLLALGDLGSATVHNRIAFDHFVEWGDLEGQANALRVFSQIAQAAGDHERAGIQIEEALALARRSGSVRELVHVLVVAVRYYRERGQDQKARHLAEEGARLGGPYRAFFEEFLR